MEHLKLIEFWKNELDINDWTIKTKVIDPEQIIYDDQTYFIAIERDFENKIGIIYHDIDLYEVAICHELLHIKYTEEMFPNLSFDEYETWIDNKSQELVSDKN